MFWILLMSVFVVLFLILSFKPRKGQTSAGFKGNSNGVLAGTLFLVMGATFLYIITDSFSLTISNAFKDSEITFKLIGSLFMLIMSLVIPPLLLSTKERNLILTVKEITTDPTTFRNKIVFTDENETKFFTHLSQHEKFKVGQSFNVDIYKNGSAFTTEIVEGKSAKILTLFDSDFKDMIK